jgi:flagellar biosynthetic protein FlhB
VAEQGGEKTEEPTPKRLREARKRGEVAMSRDVIGAGVYLAVFAAVSFSAGPWLNRLVLYMQTVFKVAHKQGLMAAHGAWALQALKDATLAPLVAAMAMAVGLGFMQTGGLFSFEALQPDPQRLMPSLKKVFNVGALMELVKGSVKIGLAAAVAWTAVKPLLGAFVNLTGASPRSIVTVLGFSVEKLGKQIALVVVVIGAADLLWQRHQYRKKMMMTREEVKREYKESEGDPQHKHERQRLHKELLEQRMVNAVRKADFVVVNPDHIAVAIQYDREGNAAPVVLAKGERLLAEKIKEVAREAGVPIFRDVSLARALRDVEEGDEIPEALYEAVAEILRLVYGDQPAARAPAVAPPAATAPEPTPPPGGWRRA